MAQELATQGRLALTGALTLQSAEAIHAQLLAMADQPVVEIDCSEATEVDVSVIQLILAARITASRAGRTIRLTQPASGALRETLHQGGFIAGAITAGVGQVSPDQAFWLQTSG